MDESLNEGAVKDLILRGPGKDSMIIWAAYQNAPFTIEELQKYATENELSIMELKTLIEIYMEDATDNEIEILSDMEIVILETEREGGLNEEFIDKYAHIPYHLRNWYQKPENQSGYKAKKVSSPKKKKPTKKVIEQMENLEGEIQDLRYSLKGIQSDNRNRHNESEEYSSEIIEKYGWDFLDMLNSGLSKEEKLKAIEEWNMAQDERSKEIKNSESILREHDYYYSEEEDKKEEDLEKQIDQKEEELSKLENVYESSNKNFIALLIHENLR
jgi:hypothetical protein